MIVFLDIDGVIRDLVAGVLFSHSLSTGKTVSYDDIINYNFEPAMSFQKAYSYFTAQGFKCPAYPEAGRFVKNLAASIPDAVNTLHLASEFPIAPGGVQELVNKLTWIATFFNSIHAPDHFHYTTNKKILFKKNDIIIDDNPAILNYALSIKAHPVCIKRPWNSPESSPAWDGERYSFEEAALEISNKIKQL